MARVRRTLLERSPNCPVEGVLDLLDGKWKGVILYHLLSGTLRFSELRRKLKGITQRMLTKQLRELEEDGLITRTVFAVVPPRVDYALSGRGESLRPVLVAMKEWGDRHLPPGVSASPETAGLDGLAGKAQAVKAA
ncbi:transcriptional regulator, HxlR family [Rhizobium sp. RU20A]|uniref:winged helix-turn-helix transcriptional regulator n=1 Tax=Rhizobium sp. RU20A TaxID=1907412 RepID=UPI000954C595|nr:helix-turn-helix domain-containing protein [Rhizobium sp. RU20A]SIR14970.1 transcriptional regulator, HxlR family [Rhizobium sp. RU20A]